MVAARALESALRNVLTVVDLLVAAAVAALLAVMENAAVRQQRIVIWKTPALAAAVLPLPHWQRLDF